MTGIALHADTQRFPILAQPLGQLRGVAALAIRFQETEFAFEHCFRPRIAFTGETRGEYSGFRRAAQMEALDHATLLGLGERQYARRQRAGDAECMRDLFRIQTQHACPGGRHAVRTGQPKCVKPHNLGRRLAAMRGPGNAEQHLTSRHECGKRGFATRSRFFTQS